MLRLGLALVGPRDPQRPRARIGRFARTARTVIEAERIAAIERRLSVQVGLDRSLRITTVDAHDGALRVLDRWSGVLLVPAVAASCAVPGVYPAVTTNGTRYMDGGVRSPADADLAEGAARVVVLAPIVHGVGPLVGVAQLRAAGSRVPDRHGDDRRARCADGPAPRRPPLSPCRSVAPRCVSRTLLRPAPVRQLVRVRATWRPRARGPARAGQDSCARVA